MQEEARELRDVVGAQKGPQALAVDFVAHRLAHGRQGHDVGEPSHHEGLFRAVAEDDARAQTGTLQAVDLAVLLGHDLGQTLGQCIEMARAHVEAVVLGHVSVAVVGLASVHRFGAGVDNALNA